MLLGSTTRVPDTLEWALEVKFDGMRAQARVDVRHVTVRSRPGRDCTAQFPELQALAENLPGRALLDGELVCFTEEGHPDFERLRGRLCARTACAVAQAQAAAPACLMIFDVLHFAGKAWRARPYRERRRLLDDLAIEGSAWRTPRAFRSMRVSLGRRAIFSSRGSLPSKPPPPTTPVGAASRRRDAHGLPHSPRAAGDPGRERAGAPAFEARAA